MPGPDLEALRAEARHARQRFDLYKARTYGPRPTNPRRLRELERLSEAARARLRAAQADPGAPRDGAA